MWISQPCKGSSKLLVKDSIFTIIIFKIMFYSLSSKNCELGMWISQPCKGSPISCSMVEALGKDERNGSSSPSPPDPDDNDNEDNDPGEEDVEEAV